MAFRRVKFVPDVTPPPDEFLYVGDILVNDRGMCGMVVQVDSNQHKIITLAGNRVADKVFPRGTRLIDVDTGMLGSVRIIRNYRIDIVENGE